ncbi:MAG: YbgC/FadM family acyl-CoA thioesterase [Rickettsiales bacterium]|jgi:acyl-CoA thioester hydrolase|nr:YbgC/FadM family acyl-CoA thioesterase [Rickettsiales bacterium]
MYSFKRRVYFCDTDGEGIVYHSRYLDFCEQSRTEFMISIGFPQDHSLERFGFMYVIRKIEMEYKTPAKFENMIDISIDRVERKGPVIRFHQTITNLDNSKIVVECRVDCVCVDKNFKLIKKIPDIMIDVFKKNGIDITDV